MTAPRLTMILACPHGWRDLIMVLPGLQSQTIASEIELLLPALAGTFPDDIDDRIAGLHSVRVIETANIYPRGQAVAGAVSEATAPFIGLHENHAFLAPATCEIILNAMTEKTGCLTPVNYCANPESLWSVATTVVAHGHAAAPVDGVSTAQLTLHQGIYPAEVLKPRADMLENETALHRALFDEGFEMRIQPETVLWHVESVVPSMAISVAHMIGQLYGASRGKSMGTGEKILRALAFPAIAAITMRRYLAMIMGKSDLELIRWKVVPHVACSSAAFAFGEVRGYFNTGYAIPHWFDVHEYDLVDRMGKGPHRNRTMIEMSTRLDEPLPAPIAPKA